MKCTYLSLAAFVFIVSTGFVHADDHDEMSELQAPQSSVFSFFTIKGSLTGQFPLAPLKQVIGFYSKGSINNANAFDLEGDGFVKLHRPRNRMYASYDMIEIIKEVASDVMKTFPTGERLQIGDCSAIKGGAISGHASHQNGLDADYSFYRLDHKEQDPEDVTGFPDTFVSNGKVTSNFDTERNWYAFKELVKTKRVLRIFMDDAIKNHLCEYAKSIGELKTEEETLRRFRPYPNHDNHFHLRITCPANSPGCVPQEEVPPGSGCP